MSRLSIRWLLLGVAATSLLLPVLAVLFLRSFDAELIRQTERELSVQGAVVAAAYQEAWAKEQQQEVGDPRDRWHSTNTYTPYSPQVLDVSRVLPGLPDPLPQRPVQEATSPTAGQAYEELSRTLRHAQVFNLSGVRVLDQHGCAVASSREQIDSCFLQLPEVQQSLKGAYSSVLRKRVSDEPAPPLASLRRGGNLRVFVALPVWNNGQVIGSVWLSRTAESGLEWLFKQRRDIFYGSLAVLSFAVLISFVFSLLITRPLSKMAQLLRNSDSKSKGPQLSQLKAPAEIHTLGVALDERSRQLSERSRYIADFAANVSHELKTPLTSIRGATELLLEKDSPMNEAQRARFLANIDAAAARTERLVNRLLQLARLETSEENSNEEQVDVVHFAQDFCESHAEQLTLQIDASLQQAALSQRQLPASSIETVLSNLVDNALRYRRTQPVQVHLSHHFGKIQIEVKDDGPGISDDNQKRVFERFFTTERDRGGTGLGLAIVQATAEGRGGKVKLQSNAQGTQVTVWL